MNENIKTFRANRFNFTLILKNNLYIDKDLNLLNKTMMHQNLDQGL